MPAPHVRSADEVVTCNRNPEGEVSEFIEQASGEGPSGGPMVPLRSRLHTVDVGSPASFGREDIYGDDGR